MSLKRGEIAEAQGRGAIGVRRFVCVAIVALATFQASAARGITSGTALTGGVNRDVVVPNGPSGSWDLVFQDEFSGSALDTSKWYSTWFNVGGKMNQVHTAASNVTVGGGAARLQLSSTTLGALIHTYPYKNSGRFAARVGDYVEARLWIPGNGTQVYNWSAWWINSTDDYPAGGEHDIAEVLVGKVKVVYHDQDKNGLPSLAPPGYWGDAWHTYGVHRKVDSADVYWDGNIVRSYQTNDDGRPLDLILNIGVRDGSPTMLGADGALRIDYVRAWRENAAVEGALGY